MNMMSKTKPKVSEIDIKKLVYFHFNEYPLSIIEVKNGFFASIFIIELSDKKVVLKVAPNNQETLLTYEKDIMQREIKVYELFKTANIPSPEVLHVNLHHNIIPFSYYLMEYLEGRTVFEQQDTIQNKQAIYKQVMMYLAEIHKVKMDYFGYDNEPIHSKTMSSAYHQMIQNLINDGQQRSIVFPDYIEEVLHLLPTFTTVLDTIKQPSLLHFDLWAGNIFIDKTETVIGLIDTERSFNGDPIAEFAAMHVDPFTPENGYLLDTYNTYADLPILDNDNSRTRLTLYKFYMYFLMYVESFYRDVNGSFEQQKKWCESELKQIRETLTKKGHIND